MAATTAMATTPDATVQATLNTRLHRFFRAIQWVSAAPTTHTSAAGREPTRKAMKTTTAGSRPMMTPSDRLSTSIGHRAITTMAPTAIHSSGGGHDPEPSARTAVTTATASPTTAAR